MQRDYLLSIFKNCDFYNLAEDNYEEKILYELPGDFSYQFFHGVSKLCIIPEGADYVIKIPFNSFWDIDTEEFLDFENANFDDEHYWDYCFTEVICYNKAKSKKVNKAFCKAKLLGLVNDYPIYIQERAETYYNLKKKGKNQESDYNDEDDRTPRTKDYCKKHGFFCFNPIWCADAIEYYGKKRFNKIMSFVKENNIGDLHTDNIGYVGRKPVFIDFSDYNS